MIERIEKTIDGEEIKVLVPENEEDERKLKRMQQKGEVDISEGNLDLDVEKETEKILGY
jgi:hypothetical protein